jgi:hypothetical protein
MTRPRSFGVSAPAGYVVLAFREEREAGHAREALLTGGYDDVMQFSSPHADIRQRIETAASDPDRSHAEHRPGAVTRS